jgi:hypothetical protein
VTHRAQVKCSSRKSSVCLRRRASSSCSLFDVVALKRFKSAVRCFNSLSSLSSPSRCSLISKSGSVEGLRGATVGIGADFGRETLRDDDDTIRSVLWRFGLDNSSNGANNCRLLGPYGDSSRFSRQCVGCRIELTFNSRRLTSCSLSRWSSLHRLQSRTEYQQLSWKFVDSNNKTR